MQAHHTTRGWLAVEWHLGVGGISLLNFCNAYSSLPGNHCPLPGDVYSTVPCLGTFASALPGHVCSPCLGRLPLPCLGTLASVHALPGHHQGLQSLPGTLAGSLLWNVCQFRPGNVCQCPAWARFAVPAWDALPVPCLGINVCQCPAWACLPVPAWECFSVAVHVLNKKSYWFSLSNTHTHTHTHTHTYRGLILLCTCLCFWLPEICFVSSSFFCQRISEDTSSTAKLPSCVISWHLTDLGQEILP